MLLPFALRAGTPAEEQIPPLRPPKSELPPGFWEQNGFWFLAAGFVILTLALVAVLLLMRLRAQPAPEPIVRARRDLEPFIGKTEDGPVLSRVSHALKAYYQSAFALPEREFTTTEFCQAIDTNESIGPELAAVIGDFLHRCDRRKFAPTGGSEPLDAARTALSLVEAGEQRRKDAERAAEKAEQA
jgi:hypothetical protein